MCDISFHAPLGDLPELAEVAKRTRKSILGSDSSTFRWLDSKFSDDAVSSGQHGYRLH